MPSPRARRAIRIAALIASVVLSVPLLPRLDAFLPLAAASPLVAGGALLAAPTAALAVLAGVAVLVAAVLRRRWFCQFVCPVGFLQEHCRGSGRFAAGVRRLVPPAAGAWLFLLTLGGALAGYPLFLWLDPLALFGGTWNSWRGPLSAAAAVAGLGLPALLLIEWLAPKLWCVRVCPLGAMQDWIIVLAHRARRLFPARAPSAPPPAGGPGWERRTLLGVGLGAAWALAARAVRSGRETALRPPGAAPEDRFTGLCVRCASCIRVCPSGILRPDAGAHGIAGLLAPVAHFDSDYCREDCSRCGEVCPSGAIARLAIGEKRRRVIGPARVDNEICLLANGAECTVCIVCCPYAALAVVSSPDGFSSQPGVDLEKCTGCGACEAACPVRPRRAIRVVAPARGAQGILAAD